MREVIEGAASLSLGKRREVFWEVSESTIAFSCILSGEERLPKENRLLELLGIVLAEVSVVVFTTVEDEKEADIFDV